MNTDLARAMKAHTDDLKDSDWIVALTLECMCGWEPRSPSEQVTPRMYHPSIPILEKEQHMTNAEMTITLRAKDNEEDK
jgi:hypothetical protein